MIGGAVVDYSFLLSFVAWGISITTTNADASYLLNPEADALGAGWNIIPNQNRDWLRRING